MLIGATAESQYCRRLTAVPAPVRWLLLGGSIETWVQQSYPAVVTQPNTRRYAMAAEIVCMGVSRGGLLE
jgi:hypothetical protein